MGISGATPTLTHVNPYPPRRVRVPVAVGKGFRIPMGFAKPMGIGKPLGHHIFYLFFYPILIL